MRGNHPCSGCKGAFSKLWVHRAACCECERACREAGRCPFCSLLPLSSKAGSTTATCKAVAGDKANSKGGQYSWCHHDSRCFKCEGWSCEQCRLLQGDGELVQTLVEERAPTCVFLDFDRTVCSTKAGADPRIGQHSVDEALVAVAAAHPEVYIVTRSSHADSIAAFLHERGMPVKGVRSVKREKCSKADVILAVLESHGEGATGLFVDDDIVEHCDPRLADACNLTRMLFVRQVL